jgi:ribosomal protein L21
MYLGRKNITHRREIKMNKPASENKLASLHDIVADVLTAQVGDKELYEEADENGKIISSKELFTATPALLTVAARFLKDNEITCEVGQSKKTSKLKDRLAERKKNVAKKKLATITPIDKEMFG